MVVSFLFLKLIICSICQSPVAWIRARAFWTIDYFDEKEFSDPEVLKSIVLALLNGMSDPALPVQAAAACSIRQLIDQEGTTDLLRPYLPQLVSGYFRIMEEMENDAVLSALQVIVFAHEWQRGVILHCPLFFIFSFYSQTVDCGEIWRRDKGDGPNDGVASAARLFSVLRSWRGRRRSRIFRLPMLGYRCRCA